MGFRPSKFYATSSLFTQLNRSNRAHSRRVGVYYILKICNSRLLRYLHNNNNFVIRSSLTRRVLYDIIYYYHNIVYNHRRVPIPIIMDNRSCIRIRFVRRNTLSTYCYIACIGVYLDKNVTAQYY